ncbi:DUF2971 domain-containing protein [Catenuloplanes nepalensis]|uniref:DUF2971 domain-containing protein n=1 Tax=Catenuloplanes nepalensis TaxID=587533 RepID=UPI0027D881C2|nr:DUF2971 domain-containing protein [Catenuloplanes nepalensis]
MVLDRQELLSIDDESSRGRYGYRYIGKDGLLATLQTGKLRLAPFETMNDPREARAWQARSLAEGGAGLRAEPPLTEASLQGELDRVLRRGARLASFSRDRPNGPNGPAVALRGWANSSSWDRYADKYRGACMVFDWDLLGEELDDFVTPPELGMISGRLNVEYADTPLTIPTIDKSFSSLEGFRDHLDDIINSRLAVELYGRKNTCWSDECESRLLIVRVNVPPLEIDNPLYMGLGSSLKAIIVGAAFGDTTKLLEHVGAGGKFAGVSVYRTDLNSRPFGGQ